MEEDFNDFKQRLEDHLPSLTKSQQRIATYLLASYDEATFLSAADLAEHVLKSVADTRHERQRHGDGQTGQAPSTHRWLGDDEPHRYRDARRQERAPRLGQVYAGQQAENRQHDGADGPSIGAGG